MKNPPPDAVPVFHSVYDVVVEWYSICKTFPKRDRYILGEKILVELLNALSAIHRAKYASGMSKTQHIHTAISGINASTMLIRLTNTLEILPDKRYFSFSQKLVEIGKQLGGWLNNSQPPKPSAHHSGK